jgi:hypothetical protein
MKCAIIEFHFTFACTILLWYLKVCWTLLVVAAPMAFAKTSPHTVNILGKGWLEPVREGAGETRGGLGYCVPAQHLSGPLFLQLRISMGRI